MAGDGAPAGRLLDGRTAIVTGGGGGIGGAISTLFAAHGARVVVADIDADRAVDLAAAITDGGGVATAVAADVREPEAVAAVVDATAEAFGAADILVNNVGHYLSAGRPFHETTEDLWRALHEVNLLHVFRMTHAVLPAMIERGAGGSIVNVSSVEAYRGAPHQAVYGAYKAAVAHFTKCLALDVSEHGIRVNDIAPDVTRSLQLPYERWLSADDVERIPQWVPIGRLGEPVDPASVALFLASDLSSFVTGTTIHVDGGTRAAGGWFRSKRGPRPWTNRPYDP
jgi:NAD(P)-dependent dehydrogenase (short-subunit alcohol dehydrogenase family)